MTPAATARERAPLPPLPPGVGAGPLYLRRFGTAPGDLAIEFGPVAGADWVTEVLAACTVGVDGDAVERELLWRLPVGTRVECLLILAELADRRPLSVALACPQPACAEAVEIELTVEELRGLAAETSPQTVVQLGDRSVAFRRPTGADQRGWGARVFTDGEAAMRAVVESLVLEPGAASSLTPGDIAGIEAALDAADPLVRFDLSVRCPECGDTSPYEVDLVAHVFARLRIAQWELLSAVHRLAGHYHWSEADIVALPPWRRRRYLELIDGTRLTG